MTPQRRLIKLLDRPGLRPLLASLASRYAKTRTGLDVEVFYDGAWIRRARDRYLAESLTFDWNAAQIAGWKDDLADVLDMYRDWWFYRYQPRRGDAVVDIGAGIGEDAIVFSEAVGPSGRVLSVEAHPVTFRLLELNCRYNRLVNTTPVHRALMDRAGTVYIENRAGHKGNTVTRAGNGTSSSPVAGCTLDELCAEHQIERIDFLKLNIEGAERLAIGGMRRMIQRTRHVCIACHDFLAEQNEFYRTKAAVVEFLRRHDFEIFLREQHPEPWVRDHVYGVRRTQLA
jgi:FkbM family methyltransferase